MTFKTLLSVCLFSLIGLSQTAMAHGDHSHPVNEKQAQQIALDMVWQFTQNDPGLDFGKLPASWGKQEIVSATIYKTGPGYRIVQVSNLAETTSLYVLMSITGDVYDANFTGDFPALRQ